MRIYFYVAIDQQVKAICPIHGISFYDINDNKTWRIDFAEDATEEQKAAARILVDNFTWTDAEESAAAFADRLAKLKIDPNMKAGYLSYKGSNPKATFSDYVTYLDAIEL